MKRVRSDNSLWEIRPGREARSRYYEGWRPVYSNKL